MASSDSLRIQLDNRIDANNANEVSKKLNDLISASEASDIELDACSMEYISSAGLRVLLSIRKNCPKNVVITNVSNDVYDIFDVTGFNQILDVRRRMREVSVEGCKIIGHGYCGNVYRLDPETIIKVYENEQADSLEAIEHEKQMAKLALVGGIPTAVSYDIVKVGNHYGSVFELLNAESFNDIMVKDPQDAKAITLKFVEFLKVIHNTEIKNPLLGPAKQKFFGYLDSIRGYLTEELYNKLYRLVSGIKDSHNVVHGDPQMKNIMMVDGEPMLIDMDTLCAGLPIFDLQAFYATYRLFGEDEPDNTMKFLGIEQSLANEVWDWVLENYYSDKTEEERKVAEEKISILARIRFMHIVATSSLIESELGKLRIKHSIEYLSEICEKYEDLNI